MSEIVNVDEDAYDLFAYPLTVRPKVRLVGSELYLKKESPCHRLAKICEFRDLEELRERTLEVA